MQGAARLSVMVEKLHVDHKIAETVRRLRGGVEARAGTLLIVALTFLGLVGLAHLSPWSALAGYLLIAAMIVMLPDAASRDGDGEVSPSDEESAPTRRGSEGGPSWRSIIEAMPDAAVVLDGNGRILHHNAMVSDLYPRIKSGQDFAIATRNPELNAALDKAQEAHEPVVVQLFERVPVERRLEANISRLARGRGGRGVPHILIVFRDLTEQDRLDQMRADFIANASHELRTPLASLKGFVETLQGPARDDPAARAKFLNIMASQAARMTRLIDDLLSLSRVEMRAHLPPRGTVDLNEVASYVAQALEPVAEAAKARITMHKAEGPARVRGERDEIVQVLQNLIHNAIKYGREGGHVEVRVSRVFDGQPLKPHILVAVSDDGPGIAPEHLPRLTERFYRANVDASREKGGTGLGLAIVKHIVARHRGDLRIASEVGKGSTFSVLFEELDGGRGLKP